MTELGGGGGKVRSAETLIPKSTKVRGPHLIKCNYKS